MKNTHVLDCLIIGAGPAGYSAAIYAARADLKPVVYTGLIPGGQLMNTKEVENYPGFTNGIYGPELMENMKSQALRFGVIINHQSIIKVDFSQKIGGIHILYAENGDEIKSRGVIIATGAYAKYLGIDSEERFKGRGVSACAACDGFFYKGKIVAIVGGGDTAIEDAIYLSKICRLVHILVRKGKFKASKAMQNSICNITNIKIHFYHEVIEVLGYNFVNCILVINNQNKQYKKISIDGLFIAIGHSPNTDIFRGQIQIDDMGYIITKKVNTCTSVPGVFAAGDVQDSIYRQAITSAGSGCMAALDLERYIFYE